MLAYVLGQVCVYFPNLGKQFICSGVSPLARFSREHA